MGVGGAGRRRPGWARAALALAAAGLGLAGVASAASLSLRGTGLGAGSADVRCDPDGVTVTQNLSEEDGVVSVAVEGLAAACAGETVRVTVRNATASGSGGPVTVPSGGGTVTVTLGSAVPISDAHSVAVLVLGP